MMTHRHLRHWPGRAAALLALLALVLRLSAAMAMPVPAAATLDVLLGVAICHGGGETDAPGGQPAVPAHDCTLCPACFIPLPGLAGAPAFIPAPPPVATQRFVLPAAGAGPPVRAFASPQPRAPPHPA